MRQTLFLIPHDWFQGPLLIGWLLLGLAIFAFLVWRKGFKGDAVGFLPIYVVLAAVIWFVLPELEIFELNADGELAPVGLAIRGYGFMMLLGMIAGMTLSIIRGRQVGIPADRIISLCFWLVVSGLIGARLLYVIQKWQRFEDSRNLASLLGSMVNMTEGGLVVYGSVVGAVVGGLIFLRITRLPVLKLADVVAPGMVIGLALGRIGCLMNGCCFGGPCDIDALSVRFPPESPPYLRQLETGELLGIEGSMILESDDERERGWFRAESVESDSLAGRFGVQPGDRYLIDFDGKLIVAVKRRGYDLQGNIGINRLDAPDIRIPISELPRRSQPIHPTQIYSAINAGLLCLVLWFYFPFRRYNGQVFALMMILYSITRFLLEAIRTDEMGFLGTPFTISQWISFAALIGGFLLFLRTRSQVESLPAGGPQTR